MMLEYGMHGVSLILFDYGIRLLLHPFYLAMYEAIGCSIGQLVPNAVIKISGVIPLYAKKEQISSVRLFFSIYGVQYYNDQVYFDRRSKRPKIFNVKSPNSGYHQKWLYLYGPDFEFVRLCRRVSDATIEYLNHL